MMKKLTYIGASALSMFALIAVAPASFLFVFQGDAPEELLK